MSRLLTHSVVSDSCGPMGCSLPGSSAHGVFQARIRDTICISCLSFPTVIFKKKTSLFCRKAEVERLALEDKDAGWGFRAPMEPQEVWVTAAFLENPCGAPASGNKPKQTLGTRRSAPSDAPVAV